MNQVGGERNYRWGCKAGYAGVMAINEYMRHRYATRYAHVRRWNRFDQYLRSIYIRDVRDLNRETIEDYADSLRDLVENDKMKISYAVNLLSTVNVVLEIMRQDRRLWLSPRKFIGSRTGVRKVPPKGMDMTAVQLAIDKMTQRGAMHEAGVIELARVLGLRKKEACLFDAKEAITQALTSGQINISRGTKGGRGKYIERLIEITDQRMALLNRMAYLQGNNQNLIPEGKSLKSFIKSVNYHWSIVREEVGLGTIHDLRACYACERYQELSGQAAPVFTKSKILASKENHNKALSQISHETGHNRKSTAVAYVGGGH
jgi:hypothetical protein